METIIELDHETKINSNLITALTVRILETTLDGNMTVKIGMCNRITHTEGLDSTADKPEYVVLELCAFYVPTYNVFETTNEWYNYFSLLNNQQIKMALL